MTRLERRTPRLCCSRFTLARWAAANTLLAEADQFYFVTFLGEHRMGFVRMLWRPFWLVVAVKLLATVSDHLRGAAFSSERFLMTALPVDSDLIRTIGSS